MVACAIVVISRPTYTSIFSLPREEIQKSCQWLTNKAEAYPEYAISNNFPIATFHLFERKSGSDERDLHNHAHESNA